MHVTVVMPRTQNCSIIINYSIAVIIENLLSALSLPRCGIFSEGFQKYIDRWHTQKEWRRDQ